VGCISLHFAATVHGGIFAKLLILQVAAFPAGAAQLTS
jgi:hypothetical protein